MTLSEVLIALGVILVSLLTMIAYVATIHRAAREGKSQAVASIYARDMLERIRDSKPLFDTAASATGLVEIREETLLEGETVEAHNEANRKSATEYRLEGRAQSTSSSIYRTTVTVTWQEEGRERKVVLESRSQPPAL